MQENPLRPNEQALGGFHLPRPDDARDARVQAALKALAAGIERIVDSTTFRQYLETMSRFHHYSCNNVLRIMQQRPDATRVAGFRTWEKLDRHVRKGEQAIKIITPRLAPYFYADPEAGEQKRGERLIGWGVGNVFDISQPHGKPLPAPRQPERLAGDSDAGSVLFGHLANLTTELGGKMARQRQRFIGKGNGGYEPRTNEIAVSAALRGDAAVKTLGHEVAHVVAHHRGFELKADVETVAESTAFVVLNHYGIDSGAYTFDDVATWAHDQAVLQRNLTAIQTTSHQIITGFGNLSANPPRTSMVVYDRARSREKSHSDSGVQAW